MAEPSLVGRADELSQICELLDRRDCLPAAGLVVGEAGIGKTTLWLAATALAADRGYRVLSSRPSEVETGYSFAGLTDILADVVDEMSTALPSQQRHALDAALLRGSDEGSTVEERVVAAAFLGTLRALSEAGPVVVAVDDVQWLDAPSLAALRFALARLRDEPVGALLTARGDLPNWVRRTLPAERLTLIELRPLSVGALQELLRVRLGRPFTRPVLLRLWETSDGNPFFALELARALERRGGRVEPGRELTIPSTLEALVDERLTLLTPKAVEVCRVVAALAEPTAQVIEESVGEKTPRASRTQAVRTFSRSTANGSASPIHCSPRRSPGRCHPRRGERYTRVWPLSSPIRRSGPATSRWRRPSRTRGWRTLLTQPSGGHVHVAP